MNRSLLLLVLALMCDAHATEAQLYILVLCPTGNSIAMRHDKRDRNGVIVKSVWKRQCLAPSKVVNGSPRRYTAPRNQRT